MQASEGQNRANACKMGSNLLLLVEEESGARDRI